jgi:hypothetical protein
MSRAKYGSDPRPCPGCGSKMLYSRMEALGVRVDPLDVGCQAHVDVCNACRGRFHKGQAISTKGMPRMPANVAAEQAALLAHAEREDVSAELHREEAARARALAAALIP